MRELGAVETHIVAGHEAQGRIEVLLHFACAHAPIPHIVGIREGGAEGGTIIHRAILGIHEAPERALEVLVPEEGTGAQVEVSTDQGVIALALGITSRSH